MLYIDTGVPQDSVLGPLFFLIFINDFTNCVQSDCVSYADDAAVICYNKTISQLQLQTEQEMKGVTEWTLNNKLSLNIDKTQCLFFTNRVPSHNNSESLIPKTGTNQLEVKPGAKCLGVFIDNQLT